jgi:hypothetical protein
MKKQKQNQDPIKFSEPQTDYSLENTPNTSQNFNKSIFNCKTIIKKKKKKLFTVPILKYYKNKV